jgi:hypothetical protein
MLMSTLRNVVQTMGGDLEVRAVFPDRILEISTFSFFADKVDKLLRSKKKQQIVEAHKLEASIDRGGAVSLHRPQANRNASNGLPL